MRRESVESHTRALASSRLAGAKGAGVRHAREWSTEIRPMVHQNPTPRLAGAQLPFAVWIFGYLAVKFRILTDRYKI
jgi:hypothetical protein